MPPPFDDLVLDTLGDDEHPAVFSDLWSDLLSTGPARPQTDQSEEVHNAVDQFRASTGGPDGVRQLFTNDHDQYDFGPPCSEADIARAEALLGESLPSQLRELYLAFNGFTGCTGASFLWPLFGERSLVDTNRLYRSDEVFPRAITSTCLFFGDNGCRRMWAFKRDMPGRIIQWNLSWPDEVDDVGDSPLAVWVAEKARYDELADEEGPED